MHFVQPPTPPAQILHNKWLWFLLGRLQRPVEIWSNGEQGVFGLCENGEL